MNPAEIRSLYVETLARAQRTMDLDRDWTGKVRPEWDGCSEHMRDEYRTYVTPMVTALAAAGLLPTGVEKRAIDGGEKWVHVDGSHSVLAIYGSERRYFTDWREVSE